MNREEFIEAVEAKRSVDFDAASSPPTRTLEADWLKEALSDHDKPVIIKHAYIRGDLALEGATIKGLFVLEDCILEGVAAHYCVFQSWVCLKECTFDTLRLRGSTFDSALWLRGSIIAEKLDLGYVTVKTDLDLDKVSVIGRCYGAGVSVEKNLHARNSTFRGEFWLTNSLIHGQVDITGSQFYGPFNMSDSRMQYLAMKSAKFYSTFAMERGVSMSLAYCAEAVFGADATFNAFRAEGQFILIGAVCKGGLNLEGIGATDLFMMGADVTGAFSTIGCNIFSFCLDDCKIRGKADLKDMVVHAGGSLNRTDWCDEVRLERSVLGSSLAIIGTKEKPALFKCGASLSGMKVGGQIIIEHAQFPRVLAMEAVSLGADFFLQRSTIDILSAPGARIGGKADFTETRFRELVDLESAYVRGHLILKDCIFDRTMNANRSDITLDVDARGSTFVGAVSFEHANLRSHLRLSGAKLSQLSLRMSTIGSLMFDERLDRKPEKNWQFQGASIDLQGCTYEQITTAWEPLVEVLCARQETVDIEPLFQLERYLRSLGRDDWADEVYYRARKETARRSSRGVIARAGDLLIRAVSGYGVKPARLVSVLGGIMLTSILFVGIPGAARPITIQSETYRCDQVPPFIDRIVLAVSSTLPGVSQTVDGWTLSDCKLTALGIKPFLFFDLLQIIAVVLIPFIIASVVAFLRYRSH